MQDDFENEVYGVWCTSNNGKLIGINSEIVAGPTGVSHQVWSSLDDCKIVLISDTARYVGFGEVQR